MLVIPFTIAEISLTKDLKDHYNLGDAIESSFEIDQSFEGLFKLSIICKSFDLNYFTILVDTNDKVQIAPPQIKPITRMKGNCRLRASLEKLDKEVVDTFESDQFIVTDELSIEINIDKDLAPPGESITIDGNIAASYDNLEGLSAVIAFNGKQETISFQEKKFTQEFKLEEDISSGDHLLFVEAKDNYGNNGDASITITVKPKITELDLKLNKESFLPEETIEISPIIYDQSKEAINDENILVKIFKGNEEFFSKIIKSNQKTTYTFPKHSKPGTYKIKATYESLNQEKSISVIELKELDIHLEGETAIITNIGNVRYNEVVNFNLHTEEKSYFIRQSVRLNPGDSMELDLSKKVPTDTYNIKAVVEGKEEPIAENIEIEDKRTPFTKISGAAISVAHGTGNPLIAIIILIIIVIAISVYIIKKRKK